MKKLLLLALASFTFLVSGCQEVTDLIQIQQANKDIESMHINLAVDTEVNWDALEAEDLDISFDQNLGMNMAMDVSNGVVHSFSSVSMFGIEVTVEQYSRVEDGQRMLYTNVFGMWTKTVATDEGLDNLTFNSESFMSALNGSFEIIDPITVDGEELTQMQLTMTLEDIQNIFGVSFAKEDMEEFEKEDLLSKEVHFVLGYNRDDYLIQRVHVDFTDIVNDLSVDDYEMTKFDFTLTLSQHNEIGEIVIPDAALNAIDMTGEAE